MSDSDTWVHVLKSSADTNGISGLQPDEFAALIAALQPDGSQIGRSDIQTYFEQKKAGSLSLQAEATQAAIALRREAAALRTAYGFNDDDVSFHALGTTASLVLQDKLERAALLDLQAKNHGLDAQIYAQGLEGLALDVDLDDKWNLSASSVEVETLRDWLGVARF